MININDVLYTVFNTMTSPEIVLVDEEYGYFIHDGMLMQLCVDVRDLSVDIWRKQLGTSQGGFSGEAFAIAAKQEFNRCIDQYAVRFAKKNGLHDTPPVLLKRLDKILEKQLDSLE